KIPGAIEPRFICEMDDVHNKGVSFPMATRVSQPKIQRSLEMRSSVRIDGPIGAAVLESHPDVIGRLENLKRKRHIHDARHNEQNRRRKREREAVPHIANLLLTSGILCTRRSRTPKTRRIWRDPSGLFRRSSPSESPQSGRSRAAAALLEDRACVSGTPSSR